MNLVQQAGACAILENAVFAGADAEDFLQQLDAFLRGKGIRVWPEVLMLAIGSTAVVGQARKFLSG